MQGLSDRFYFSFGIYVMAAVSLAVYAVWCGFMVVRERITGESKAEPWALDYDD
jgi:hypothetical protein